MPAKSLVVHERIPLPGRKLANLVQQLLQTGKAQATQAIRAGSVRVNGRVLRRAETILKIGDRLDVDSDWQPVRPAARPAKDARNFEVVYHDRDVIVVNKPPRLLTVPTPRQERTTLISLVGQWLRQRGEGDQVFCVHRLDRGVSGLLVFGKRLEVAQALRTQFEARKPDRRYVAIVSGRIGRREGTFRSYLATDKQSLDQYSTSDESQGQLAITHYRVLQATDQATLVEVRLETGRRNQIRVHFAEAGHPVLGDARYGRHLAPTLLWPHHRLALHAETLGFRHPATGEPLVFRAKLPSEFQAVRF
jgi:23S rRNA pseudouridine1911/1915/1917 synthase